MDATLFDELQRTLDAEGAEAAARRLEGEIAGAGLCPHIVTTEDLARRLDARRSRQDLSLIHI